MPPRPQSACTGVGQVPEDEDPLAAVRSADKSRRQRDRKRRVALSLQVSPYRVNPPPCPRGDVLDDDPARTEALSNMEEAVPEAASITAKARALAGGAEVLAGEAPAQEVDGGEGCEVEGPDIVVDLRLGPVAPQHLAAEGVALALPEGRSQTSPFEAQLQTADAAEEGAYGEHARRSLSLAIAR
jgi:hypothetical protein